MLAVFVMVFAPSCFCVPQAIFCPDEVGYEYPDCGLNRHGNDAVHCKHCGRVLHIINEGADRHASDGLRRQENTGFGMVGGRINNILIFNKLINDLVLGCRHFPQGLLRPPRFRVETGLFS